MDASTHAEHARFGRVSLGILDLGVFAGTFLFRWLTVDFTNDHFVHLSRARQILLGDVPIRDFFDAGFFLQLYLSSAAQLLFGYDLFGEAVLSISFIAFGTMLVFHLSAQLSGSRWIAGSTALLMLFAFPRLYSYPKVFLYVAAIGLAWLYARRSTRLHVCLMAALTALAFLLRHDHGVYIGVMMVCFLGLHEWGSAQLWRRVGLYAGVAAGLVLPFLVFVQATTGLVSYVVGARAQSQSIASSLSSILIPPVPFKIDRSAPLWVIAPASGAVEVQSTEGADAAARRDEDTRVMDRGTLQVLPGVFTAQNALAWFYWLILWLPVIAIGVVGAGWWSGRVARPEAALVAATAFLCLIISHTLIRDNPSARLADVAAPTFVLAAWLARRRGNPTSPLFVGGLRRAGMVSLVLLTFWSVWTSSGTGTRLARAGVLDGPTGIREQLGIVNRQLHRRPIDEWAPPGSTGLRALTRYVFDCTAPSDRVLVTWFAPEVFYYAERGFAGGQVSLFRDYDATDVSGWHASPAEQRLTVERMQGQSVPIILGRRDEQDEFSRDYPLIYDHVLTRYELAAESTFGEDRSDFLVFVDKQSEPYADHPDLGLPCFREAMADINGFDDGPFINVRWVENLREAQRSALERALGLYRARHTEGTTWRYRVPDVSPDRFDTITAHGMVADTYGFDPAADTRFGPVIHVRWVEALEDARRTMLERALGLYRGEHTEGTTWRYRLPDASPDRVRAIVAHDMVADTSGFDRGSLELDSPAGDVAWLAAQPLVFSDGWHPPESDASAPDSTWRWTRQTATLSFANPNADTAFYLDYAARPNVFAEGPQTVTVSIGDQVLQSFAAQAAGRRLRRIPLAAAALGAGDRVEIQIAVDQTFVPSTLPSGGRDERELGIQVYHAFVVLR